MRSLLIVFGLLLSIGAGGIGAGCKGNADNNIGGVRFLHTEVIAGFTVLHIALAVVGLFVGLKILDWLRGDSDSGESMNITVRCGCGWTGSVSKFAPKCSKCGAVIEL